MHTVILQNTWFVNNITYLSFVCYWSMILMNWVISWQSLGTVDYWLGNYWSVPQASNSLMLRPKADTLNISKLRVNIILRVTENIKIKNHIIFQSCGVLRDYNVYMLCFSSKNTKFGTKNFHFTKNLILISTHLFCRKFAYATFWTAYFF